MYACSLGDVRVLFLEKGESRHATALRGARSRFQRPHHLQLSRSMLIRYIIVVKLIKSVIANPTVGQRKEGLRPV